jgi:hypothetical protein
MAAVIELRTGQALADEHLDRPTSVPTRPGLRLIQGGRSAPARRMRWVFLARRALVLVVALATLWLLAQVVGAALTPIGLSDGPVTQLGAVHQVESGDTLWGLASSVAPESDPRDVVDQIIQMNEGGAAISAGGQLRAGEVLRLPVGS